MSKKFKSGNIRGDKNVNNDRGLVMQQDSGGTLILLHETIRQNGEALLQKERRIQHLEQKTESFEAFVCVESIKIFSEIINKWE